MRSLTIRQRRAGNVLVLFALLTFVIFAVAALTIDMGMARLTQRQMQTATDSAAREGVRYRDEIPAWILDPNSALFQQIQQDIGGNPADPNNRDQVRRWLARNQINLTFANAIDPVTGNPVQFGAGPDLQLSGGVGNANAFQTLTMPQTTDVTVYKPNVQLNLGNAQAGDLVAGNFIPAVLPAEDATYARTDFTPQATAGDSFLARLRRTQDTHGNNRNAIDNQAGISTSGKALPLLFGQGSLIAGADPTAGYSPRHHGITVRGTSIAQGLPARSVGPAYPDKIFPPVKPGDPEFKGMRGAAPFALDSAAWTAPPAGAWATVTVDAMSGNLLAGGTKIGQMIRITSLSADGGSSITVATSAGFPAAPYRIRIDNELLRVTAVDPSTNTWTVDRGIDTTVTGPHAANAVVVLQDALAAGQSVNAAASPGPVDLTAFNSVSANASSFHVYVPLYDAASGLTAGFGLVQWTATAANQLQVLPQPGIVASENASASYVTPPPAGYAIVTPTNALLAPALVR